GQHVDARIRHGHDGEVGLPAVRARVRDRREERRLAAERHAHEPDVLHLGALIRGVGRCRSRMTCAARRWSVAAIHRPVRHEPTSDRYAHAGSDADVALETGLAGAPPDPPRPAVSSGCGTCAEGAHRAGGRGPTAPPARARPGWIARTWSPRRPSRSRRRNRAASGPAPGPRTSWTRPR